MLAFMYILNCGGCLLDSKMTLSVILSVGSEMALQPQSGFAELEAGGTLEGHCCGRGRSSSVVMISGCKLFCLLLLIHWCTCYVCEHTPVRADLGCYVEFRKLDATPLHAALQHILEATSWLVFFLCPCASSPKTKKQLLWYALITLPDDVSSPVELGFQQHHFNGGWFGLVLDFKIGDFVLPSDSQDGMECSHTELLQLPDVMVIHSPRLTALEQWCQDNSTVDFQLCGQGHIIVCEHLVVKSSKSLLVLLILTEISLSSCPSHEIMLPRYLKLLTVFISMPSIVMVGWGLQLFAASWKRTLVLQGEWSDQIALRHLRTCSAWFAGHWTCMPWVCSHQQTVLPGWDHSESLAWMWVCKGWIWNHQCGSRYTLSHQDSIQCSLGHRWRTGWKGLVPRHSLALPHWRSQKDQTDHHLRGLVLSCWHGRACWSGSASVGSCIMHV